jgi:hypothetical protein
MYRSTAEAVATLPRISTRVVFEIGQEVVVQAGEVPFATVILDRQERSNGMYYRVDWFPHRDIMSAKLLNTVWIYERAITDGCLERDERYD